MEKTISRDESMFKKVILVFKELDEKVESWVNHVIEIIENEYQP